MCSCGHPALGACKSCFCRAGFIPCQRARPELSRRTQRGNSSGALPSFQPPRPTILACDGRDMGNKRFVVRPYRAPNLLDALNQDAPDYVDPQLTPASSLEAAVVSSKTIRLRTDQGGDPAIVDSQELLSRPVPKLYVDPPAPRSPQANVPVKSASKVVLLDNSDFVDLEVQEDPVPGYWRWRRALFVHRRRFPRFEPVPTSPSSSCWPIARRPCPRMSNSRACRSAEGSRQLAYSLAKKRSASSLPITMTQVSTTLRKLSVAEPLPPGEYVVLLDNSNRGFLFEVHCVSL